MTKARKRWVWSAAAIAALAGGIPFVHAAAGTNGDCVDDGVGMFVSSAGDDINVVGGQISGAGATLFVDFFRAAASTNDWIDVDDNGFSGFDPLNFPFVQQLATVYTPGLDIPSTHWMFQYRSVGSVNGFNEFVQNQLCGTIPTSVPGEAGIFNGFEYATLGVSNNGPGANGSGTPVEPCEIEFSFLDVPSVWAVQVPGFPAWNRRPLSPGYGLNPLRSNTDYLSNLQPLSRVCAPGACSGNALPCEDDADCPDGETCNGASAPVSLNQNFQGPDEDTIFDLVGAWVPVAYIANRGTGLQDIRYSELQHLFVAGRLPSGENLAVATRSVGSGTRNAIMNSTGIDTSWGRGDNIGNESTTNANFQLGAGHQASNAQGSGQVEIAVQNRRLAIGYTGLGGPSRAIQDALSGSYEILNTCKDVDNAGQPLCDCSAQACAARMGCSDTGVTCVSSLDCNPGASCIANADAAAANNGYVRPTTDTVLDNCDACCGYTIGGNGSFVSRGDPDANRSPIDPKFDASNPPLDNQAVADYFNNVFDSIDAFDGSAFSGQCNVTETCSVKRCAGNNAVCTGTGNGNCAGGQGPCNFIACETDADCTPGSNGTCGFKPCTTNGQCTDVTCSVTGNNCVDNGDCLNGAQTCSSNACSIDGAFCNMDGDCATISGNECRIDHCRSTLNMPGQFLAATFTLPAGLDCQQELTDGMEFSASANLNQLLQTFARQQVPPPFDTPAFGSVNTAGRVPVRNTMVMGVYSDGLTGSSGYGYRNASTYVTISSGQRLSRRNRIQGDMNGDFARDIDDATGLVKAHYGPRAWQLTAAAMGTGTGSDLGQQTHDNAIPEVLGDFDGNGSFDKEDLRYFADGLAMVASPLAGGTMQLDRKAGAIAIDAAIAALPQPFPWADPALSLTVGGVFPAEPTFTAPLPISNLLPTGKTYAHGDFRGDVAGRLLAQTCVLGSPNKCSITGAACNIDDDCPDLRAEAPGAEPRGWDGVINAEDIDYVCRNAHVFADINEAVFADLSADMDGDLDVDADDIDELVIFILGTEYGDADLDGDVDSADEAIVIAGLTDPCNDDQTCGWADGDFTCDGVVNASDAGFVSTGLQPPAAPSAPHDRRKNRYVSFTPSNGGNIVGYVIERTSPPSGAGTLWVGAPNGQGISKVVSTPVLRVWPEIVVHIGDCEIMPVADYELRSTPDAAAAVVSAPLVLQTIAQPAPKNWGDTVGSFTAGAWDTPNGVVNANDFVAALQGFQVVPTAPHVSVTDVQAVSAIDPCLNNITNIADVFLLIKAFQGDVYPFETNPVNCPACP